MDYLRASIECPLGNLTALARGDALAGLWFAGQKHYPPGAEAWRQAPELPLFGQLSAWLRRYFDGENPPVDFTLCPGGSAFQKAVWDILLDIPYGKTSSYKDVAARLGCGSARAVGGAVGRNPISILIPCHRVVGASGGLTGYAGGIARKQALLRLEGGLQIRA
jgi:methylated-DNA-[protein]-cysteine S-methyltransferase